MPTRCFYLLFHPSGRIHLHPNGYLLLHQECERPGGSWKHRQPFRELANDSPVPEGPSPLELNRNRISDALANDVIIERLRSASHQIERNLKLDREESRAAENPQALFAGYFLSEMASTKDSGLSKPARRSEARRKAQIRAKETIRQRRSEQTLGADKRKVSLLNLERARIAKEAKSTKKAEIREVRLKNLKKARAAKKRRAKKRK